MNRRCFLLGTLASGLSFFTEEIFLEKDFITEFDMNSRLSRLYTASIPTLQKCKVAYANKEGLWSMPGLAKVTRLSPGVFEFKAAPLQILKPGIWTGAAFIDDEDYVISRHAAFNQDVNTIKGDKLIATYTLKIGRNA